MIKNKDVERSFNNLKYFKSKDSNFSNRYLQHIYDYVEQLERENFGLKQQVSNLKETSEKRWKY